MKKSKDRRLGRGLTGGKNRSHGLATGPIGLIPGYPFEDRTMKQKRVLIIEDELDLVSILRQGLTEAGFFVDVAYDGEEGLRKALSREADMLILDMKLPKLDGFTVISLLRNNRINTPALMLTAMEEMQDLRKAAIKADDCLIKPFRFDELLVRINRLVALKSREELKFFEPEASREERLEKTLS